MFNTDPLNVKVLNMTTTTTTTTSSGDDIRPLLEQGGVSNTQSVSLLLTPSISSFLLSTEDGAEIPQPVTEDRPSLSDMLVNSSASFKSILPHHFFSDPTKICAAPPHHDSIPPPLNNLLSTSTPSSISEVSESSTSLEEDGSSVPSSPPPPAISLMYLLYLSAVRVCYQRLFHCRHQGGPTETENKWIRFEWIIDGCALLSCAHCVIATPSFARLIRPGFVSFLVLHTQKTGKHRISVKSQRLCLHIYDAEDEVLLATAKVQLDHFGYSKPFSQLQLRLVNTTGIYCGTCTLFGAAQRRWLESREGVLYFADGNAATAFIDPFFDPQAKFVYAAFANSIIHQLEPSARLSTGFSPADTQDRQAVRELKESFLYRGTQEPFGVEEKIDDEGYQVETSSSDHCSNASSEAISRRSSKPEKEEQDGEEQGGQAETPTSDLISQVPRDFRVVEEVDECHQEAVRGIMELSVGRSADSDDQQALSSPYLEWFLNEPPVRSESSSPKNLSYRTVKKAPHETPFLDMSVCVNFLDGSHEEPSLTSHIAGTEKDEEAEQLLLSVSGDSFPPSRNFGSSLFTSGRLVSPEPPSSPECSPQSSIGLSQRSPYMYALLRSDSEASVSSWSSRGRKGWTREGEVRGAPPSSGQGQSCTPTLPASSSLVPASKDERESSFSSSTPQRYSTGSKDFASLTVQRQATLANPTCGSVSNSVVSLASLPTVSTWSSSKLSTGLPPREMNSYASSTFSTLYRSPLLSPPLFPESVASSPPVKSGSSSLQSPGFSLLPPSRLPFMALSYTPPFHPSPSLQCPVPSSHFRAPVPPLHPRLAQNRCSHSAPASYVPFRAEGTAFSPTTPFYFPSSSSLCFSPTSFTPSTTSDPTFLTTSPAHEPLSDSFLYNSRKESEVSEGESERGRNRPNILQLGWNMVKSVLHGDDACVHIPSEVDEFSPSIGSEGGSESISHIPPPPRQTDAGLICLADGEVPGGKGRGGKRQSNDDDDEDTSLKRASKKAKILDVNSEWLPRNTESEVHQNIVPVRRPAVDLGMPYQPVPTRCRGIQERETVLNAEVSVPTGEAPNVYDTHRTPKEVERSGRCVPNQTEYIRKNTVLRLLPMKCSNQRSLSSSPLRRNTVKTVGARRDENTRDSGICGKREKVQESLVHFGQSGAGSPLPQPEIPSAGENAENTVKRMQDASTQVCLVWTGRGPPPPLPCRLESTTATGEQRMAKYVATTFRGDIYDGSSEACGSRAVIVDCLLQLQRRRLKLRHELLLHGSPPDASSQAGSARLCRGEGGRCWSPSSKSGRAVVCIEDAIRVAVQLCKAAVRDEPKVHPARSFVNPKGISSPQYHLDVLTSLQDDLQKLKEPLSMDRPFVQ